MANYQILNHLGEVLEASVTEEAFNEMVELNPNLAFYLYDANPENDLVERWKNKPEDESDVTQYRIYKLIEEA